MVREGYKQTEVGVIPEDWDFLDLADVVENRRLPSGLYKEKGFYGNGHQIIKISDVFNFDYFEPDKAQRVVLTGDEISKYQTKIGDIFIALASVKLEGVGKVMLVKELDEETAFDHNVALIRANSRVLSDFIFYLLKSDIVRRQVGKSATQVGTTFLKASTILAFQLPIPSEKAEQRAIAQILSDVDALIAALDQLIAKQRHLKTATMQQLLTGKKRLPGFGEGKGYKQTEVGVIPEDWNVKAVGEICDFIVPGRNKPKVFDGDIPWITTPDLEDGRSVSNSKIGLFISREEAKSVGSRIVPAGSILMSCVGELGIVASVEREIVINQQLHAFLPSNAVDSIFLLNALQTKKEYMLSIATITAVPYLNKDNCNSIPIAFPKFQEQRAIATVLSDMDGAIAAIEARRAKTQAIKQGMMQELLTGRTRLV